MRVLISGAGIAGPTLAYWLNHYGIESTIVERAAKLRTGGYIVDFWGLGYEVADRMGLMPELKHEAYRVRKSERSTERDVRFPAFPWKRSPAQPAAAISAFHAGTSLQRSIGASSTMWK